jgi:hypothetical protein
VLFYTGVNHKIGEVHFRCHHLLLERHGQIPA